MRTGVARTQNPKQLMTELSILGVYYGGDIDGARGLCTTLACTSEREMAQLEQEQARGNGDQILGRIRAKLTDFQDTALAEVRHLGKYATARVY
ncbi:hypothetical protein NDU88_006019 [Pleurodeles waltl]|uniref:Uncharacterized protein n=1 Tax=Pleurodeles waltl TaxID=8319 RepID=A0AAV7QK03_PLEWA|nr:hypothetical protein NDU88_006019 [Pleurodeles waltl]